MLRRLILLVLGLASALAAQGHVDKIEPPSWWIGGAWAPIRLLIHGAKLNGVTITTPAPLIVSNVKVSERGTYLFADFSIPRTTAPGSYPLRFVFPGGKSQSVDFEIAPHPLGPGRVQGFDSSDFVYLIMPDRFSDGYPGNNDPTVSTGLFDRSKPRYYHGGDFQGILNHVEHLKELGVTAVWLTPWYDNSNRLNEKETYDGKPITDYHGYGAIDFYGVDEHFGSAAALKYLTHALQSIGIKVIQDQVANHTGPYHPWTEDPPSPTWFNGTPSTHIANTWQTWTLMDPYASKATRRGTLDGWFINILPDLNQNDPEVRRYLIQNSMWWVGVFGIDGIRQDTMPYAPRDYWRDWTAALKKEFPMLKVVGEVFDGDPALVSLYQGGRRGPDFIDTGVHSVFDFPLFFALRSAFARNGDLREVPKTLAHDFLYPNPNMLTTFLGLHDVERFMNEKGATTAGLKMALTALFTLRGVPLVYYGDEIGMPGGGDPDNRRDFPGGWQKDPRNAFLVQERTPEENDIFYHLQNVATLRRKFAAFRDGIMTNLVTEPQQWVYARRGSRITALVGFNASDKKVTVDVEVASIGLMNGDSLSDRLSGTPATVGGGHVLLELAPHSSSVWMQ